ncbi:hypothetical protein CTEN210_13425 [Chaetoceros tenuissimus]|uniref:Methyltransferase small domain-containing protein n=1 Tax=Chaetoceros tenuissimus TaxID=426638 RepID=A0AAD3D3A1_9STRA|nr:hypothetical protein CTEN210_13425 [Chaetoceros tenuissimus]
MTADVRISAASTSLKRQDAACPFPGICNESDDTFCNIQKLRFILERVGFNHENIQRMFGINSSTFGPVYLKPVATALNEKSFHLPPLDGEKVLPNGTDLENSSLRSLVAMFILGYAIPRSILEKNLIGGSETISLMESLGLAFPCEIDKEIIVPYVHIFPLSIPLLRRNEETGNISENEVSSMILVTDLHPTLLCRTTVGCEEDGAVMYIGPDSLALCQHKPIRSHLKRLFSPKGKNEEMSPFKLIDFCSGSGIQALSTLMTLKYIDPCASAICVDINKRALRFTKFNSLFNGMEDSRINTVHADLCDESLISKENILSISEERKPYNTFDMILCNPPFIPTPRNVGDEVSEGINKRYGQFSTGGSSGDDVLRRVVQISGKLLRKDQGLLAIVSEFMNPPISNDDYGKDDVIEKIREWWDKDVDAKGILFTNEFPLSAIEYARRRAVDSDEFNTWMENLDSHGIERVSPGLLYIKTLVDSPCGKKIHAIPKIVPHDKKLGSIWSPHNFRAIQFTEEVWQHFFE